MLSCVAVTLYREVLVPPLRSPMGLAVAGSSAGCQACVGDAVGFALGSGVTEDGGQEGLPVEVVHGGIGVRDHGGGARDGPRQRALSSSFAAPAPPQEMTVPHSVKLAWGRCIVGISWSPWRISNVSADTAVRVPAPATPSSAGAGVRRTTGVSTPSRNTREAEPGRRW